MESAAVGAILNVLSDRLASRDFINFFRGRKQEERQLLNNFKTMLLGIKPLLNDAELKQWTDPAVKDWMDELKDVIYHADDLLDEFATKAMQSKLDSEFPTSSSTIRNLLDSWSPFGQGIESRIEQIIERLNRSVKAKEALGLREVDVGRNNPPSHMLLQTTSLVDPVSVYGRDGDKEKIIQLLISDDDSSGPQLSVIPIVGMGGIGKTTLAQLVYNDPQVIKCFEEKIWVCVSHEFDILKVTKLILEELNLPRSGDNLNTLQITLRGRLAEKKFFIVLDDVWNENYGHWDKLRKPFAVGKHGSKIIVTTRNEGVASTMQKHPNVPIFYPRQLSDDDCWLLFSKIVSPSLQPDIERFRKKIVKKCKGLPLAAKTLGGLLRHKLKVEEWESVLESHFWDLPNEKCDILPVLSLSYHHLPSHLKLCFAYCATIPKGYAFEKDELVPQWIAESLVQQPRTKQQPRTSRSIDEIGDDYFHELVSRSLFQQSTIDNKFLMHDLINDLAQYVAGEYCVRFQDGDKHDISKVRYFACSPVQLPEVCTKFKENNEASCLRTFKPLRSQFGGDFPIELLRDLLPRLRCLRVLSLSRYHIVELPPSGALHPQLSTIELPDSIGNLIHLRYLNLSLTNIKCLPETICRLCNLETLLLRDCKELTRLPRDFCRLICLRHLDISGTDLREMPMQIGRLSSLQRLTNFIVGNQSGQAISELGELHLLRGALSISNLQNVLSVRDALEANLKNKEHLEKLNMVWGAEHTDDSQRAREVLDKLQPHINLKHLTIDNYGGTRFPDWLGESSFFHLKSLCLHKCTNCVELPPLVQLPSLQELTIEKMNMVTNVGWIKPFQSLEKLTFKEMPEWEEWSILGAGEFCHLQELYICNCPKLIGKFPKNFPFLKKLEISGCQVLHTVQILPLELCRLTNLEELKIFNCPVLNTIQIMGGDHQSVSSQPEEEMKHVNTKFRSLEIENCPELELPLSEDTEHSYKFLQDVKIRGGSCNSLKSFPLGFFPKLCSLEIDGCRNLESLSGLDGIQNLTSLQPLEIRDCPNLKALPEQMCTLLPSLQSLKLVNLPEIECFPLGGLPSSLDSLNIINCKKLMARRTEWGLQRLPSLSYCYIGDECEEDKLLESFPEECLLPTSLTSLIIRNRPHMKSLNPNGLRHLNSLQFLTICQCPKLQSLPDEGLPSSLVNLNILNCPLLTVRCEREKGEDWHKISHIPIIQVDEKRMYRDQILNSNLKSVFLHRMKLRSDKRQALKRLEHGEYKEITEGDFL